MEPMETLIEAETLNALLEAGQPRVVLLDARFDLASPQAGYAAWQENHLPGAFFADLERDLSGPVTPTTGRHPLPAPAALAACLERWGVDSDRGDQVVVYDGASGAFAARVWWLLRWLGHRSVAVLDGGIRRWQALGYPVTSEAPPAPPPSRFEARPDDSAWLTTEQLGKRLASEGERGLTLVDARAAARYAGEQEPIDPVAGHVPGAINHPFDRNLTAQETFQPAEQLKRTWSAVLGDRQPSDVVAMCGSGVTACHLLLAMAHAGLDGGRLYAGSWSEWIRDPARPVARGTAP